MADLFETHEETVKPAAAAKGYQPLADRVRPQSLDQMIGHEDLLGETGFLRRAIVEDRIPSLILWGPPGCGKTTIAHVISHHTKAFFEPFSAVLGGLPEVRVLLKRAQARHQKGQRTILFMDEIHRFNKGQQDAFLPHVEAGTIVLIGATTENPSFTLNSALLSRCRVVRLSALSSDALTAVLEGACDDSEQRLGADIPRPSKDVLALLVQAADGDARRALTLLEQIQGHCSAENPPTTEIVKKVLEGAPIRHDRDGDAHYDTISAFIKSMRGSDPDAALYYGARLIESGEDPRFLLRRIMIFASEDIGNADPRALELAVATTHAYERLGMPEARLCLAQAITYCATAPKSNASYKAWDEAVADVRKHGSLPIPIHLRNAPTKLMKELGHGRDYRYPHDAPGHFLKEEYLPEELVGRRYYAPSDQGYEQRISERLRRWWAGEPDES
ncbi:MAG: AAA family ATPase [Myxococcales bacterium]|nr:AAA family ATPase [Myxococcales bacterium]